ncbi:hypothetical protein FB479_110157 [Brevibacillus sp. AG162]|nr:hypothetical protein FB479_110157 [Brevibacillus sp. AG162]
MIKFIYLNSKKARQNIQGGNNNKLSSFVWLYKIKGGKSKWTELMIYLI